MKNLKLILFSMLFLAVGMTGFAMTQDAPAPSLEPSTIVGYLAPFITLGVTALIRWAKPMMGSGITIMVVAGLSVAVAWIANLTSDMDGVAFFMQVLYGLLAIVINQIYRALNGGNAKFARAKS